jgi:septum site-determining protein MinC
LEGQHVPPDSPGDPEVQITPTRSGVRIRLPAGGDFHRALAELSRVLETVPALRGAAVTVDAAGRALDVAQLREIEGLLLERHGAALLQVVEGRREGEPAVAPSRRLGRRRRAADPTEGGGGPVAAAAEPDPGRSRPGPSAPEVAAPAAEVPGGAEAPAAAGGVPVLTRVRPAGSQVSPSRALPVDMTPTLLVRRTLRSGQRVRFNGNVVVLGDVNPGAEIVASGDIVVMGTLRGVAHAGATGSAEAVVVAFRLQPVQLRVGTVIGRAPDGQAPRPDGPEVARVRDGALVIERFQPAGGE